MEYKLTTEEPDPRDANIEKRGVVVNFTFNQLEREDAMYTKVLKEITAKRDYEAAKMKNIEDNHPFVLSMSEEDMFTAHMYQDSKAIVMVSNPKIAEIEKLLKENAEEKIEMIKQIPALGVPVVTPAAPVVEEAVGLVEAPAEPVVSPLQAEDLKA